MSVDIATLGLQVESSGVVTASSRLNTLTREGGNAERSVNSLSSSTANLTKLAQLAASAFAAWKLAKTIEECTMLAARVETLSVVLKVVGNNAGYTSAQMDGYVTQVKKMGITTQESMNSLIKMAGAQMDLNKASQLARVAQDAAVIGNINSSEAFGRLIQGIRSGEVEILKTIGINVQFEQSYKKAAEAMGKTADQLTNTEKTAARMNAVLEFGTNIAGAYEASMGTAGKQILSMSRYTEELKLKIGEAFNPGLAFMVGEITRALKGMDTQLADNRENVRSFADDFKLALASVAAEVQRVSMLIDLAGGTLTSFGSRALKVAEVVTRFMTIGQFGDWFKDKSEALARANTLYAQRYAAGEAELQRLADATTGNASTGRTKAQEDAALAASAAQKAKELADAQKAAAIAGAAAAERWRATYADLRKEIDSLNPTMTEQEKAVLAVANKYEDLAHKKGANVTLLQRLKAEHVKAISDHYAMADAIKATSDEFKEYLRLSESEPAKNNDAGEMSLRWSDELEMLKSLQPSAGIDALNDQISMFERLLSDIPSKSEEVAAAVAKLKADFAASSGLDALLKGNTELNTSLITDPYAQERQRIQDRYDYERDQQEKALKRAEKDADLRAAIEKRLSLLKKEYIKDTLEVDAKAQAAKLGNAAMYTGMASDLFAALASTQDESSRSGFESAKAMNLAAAVASTAAAVMNQMAGGDPYTAFARAAAAGALGAIQIAKIASTSYGSGGSVATVSSGSFAAGGAGTSGSSVGPQIHSVQGTQTEDSLRALAVASDNASMAIGKVADGLTSIADLFNSGYSKNIGAGLASGGYAPPSGIWGSEMSNIRGTIKDGLGGLTGDLGSLFKSIGNTLIAPFNFLKNGIFGGSWYTSGGGISLGLQGGAFSGMSYTERTKDGGWFSGDKHRTDYSSMDAGAQEVFSDYITQIKSAIARAAVSTGTITDFASAQVSAMNISTAGRSAEDIQKDLENFFNTAANELAKTTSGLEEFSFYGENAFDALIRLSTSLQGVNEQLSLIGHTLVSSTLQGADLAYRLADAFGGLDKMQEATDNYLAAMFSDHEQEAMRAAAAQREVNVAFAEMGRAVPQTREEFRALVNSLDLNTDSATFVSLMNISEAFGTVREAADNAAKDLLDSQRDLQSRWLHATASAEADLYDLRVQQEQELQDYISRGLDTTRLLEVQAREYTNALSATFKTPLIEAATSAANAIKSILGGNLSTLSPEAQYKSQREAFASALASGQTGQLGGLGQSFLAASKSYYGSSASYAADYDTVMQALANVAGIADPTLDAAQKQIDLLQRISDNTSLYVTATTTLAQLMSQQLGVPVGLPRFAGGGITRGLALAGESGPEAVIPLPDGRSVPVTMQGGNDELLAELKALREEVSELRKQSVGKLTDIEAPLRRVAARG